MEQDIQCLRTLAKPHHHGDLTEELLLGLVESGVNGSVVERMVSEIARRRLEAAAGGGVRDPARIDRLLRAIRTLWYRHPDQRLGQLLMNVTGVDGSRVFYLEDDTLEYVLGWRFDESEEVPGA